LQLENVEEVMKTKNVEEPLEEKLKLEKLTLEELH